MIVNKPPKVLSQPGNVKHWIKHASNKDQQNHKSIVLLDELRAQSSSSAKELLEWRLVHRLDSCVTGGMLVAKNKNAAACFSRNLKMGGNRGYKVKRKYVAMVHGTVHGSEYGSDYGLIDKEGMISKYRRFDEHCLIMELVTGKKHQIRQHLSYELKQPILNDFKYLGPHIEEADSDQIALHSACIKTKIGLQDREHLIPMNFQNNGKLWPRQYLDEDGQFIPEIQKMLLEEWDF